MVLWNQKFGEQIQFCVLSTIGGTNKIETGQLHMYLSYCFDLLVRWLDKITKIVPKRCVHQPWPIKAKHHKINFAIVKFQMPKKKNLHQHFLFAPIIYIFFQSPRKSKYQTLPLGSRVDHPKDYSLFGLGASRDHGDIGHSWPS